MFDFMFFLESIMLGVGLAMDAFSVSLANGLNEPLMKKRKMCGIAVVFAVFQTLMPMIGWVCVHTIATYFTAFEKFIPWIALILLVIIGGKMVIDGVRKKDEGEQKEVKLGVGSLMLQGIATSIDALSVGFTIADYEWYMALTETVIIGAVTFAICIAGLLIGRKFGTRLSDKAQIVGGVILILIGLEIFITSFI